MSRPFTISHYLNHTPQYVALLLFISAGIVRASSVFPILSTCLLMLGGLCVGVGRVYNKTNNVLLSAGILFVAAGESAIHPPRSNRVRAGVSKCKQGRLI